MQCARCQAETFSSNPWCKDCEYTYDGWSRQHASDLLWQLGGAAAIVSTIALGIPLLGASTIIAATAIFAGFGTLLGLNRLNRRRRRQQFLAAGDVPKMYLPPGKPTA